MDEKLKRDIINNLKTAGFFVGIVLGSILLSMIFVGVLQLLSYLGAWAVWVGVLLILLGAIALFSVLLALDKHSMSTLEFVRSLRENHRPVPRSRRTLRRRTRQ